MDIVIAGAGEVGTHLANMLSKQEHNIMLIDSDEEKLELEDFSKSKKKFFVRSSSSKEDIEKVFGNVEYVDANIDGEFGFITEKISEATFAKKADELGTVISRIRIEG